MAVATENTIQLTDQNPAWPMVDSRGIRPVIYTIAHPWAVLLNDNVYVKDTSTAGSLRGESIWQYSIQENTWSQHSRPELFGFKKYTLTVYRSQLACIGGFVRCEDIEEHTENKCIFAWDGHKWKDDDVQQIPEDEKLPSSDELSASSDDTRLYLAWQKDNKVQILQYSRQSKWEKREGPDCESSGSHIEISIFKKNIFLTEHNDKAPTVINKASIAALSSGAPGNIWTRINWGTDLQRDIPQSFFSNITITRENIVLLTPLLSSRWAVLYNLQITSDSAYWEKVGRLEICWKCDSHPSIFGVKNKSLLVMGCTEHLQATDANICVLKSGTIQ